MSGREAYQAFITDAGEQRPTAGNATALAGIAVLCGWGITLFAVLYPLHLASVLATSTAAGLESLGETVQAVEQWSEEQRASGQTDFQIAQLLDQHGRSSADSADSGLPALLPRLEAVLGRDHGAGIGQCRVAAGAGTTALVREVDWRDEQPASSGLRYCVRVACPSPTVWAAPAPVVLYSNQASQKEQWSRYLFLDLRAQGRAPVPGGNCTAEGDLADRFQG